MTQPARAEVRSRNKRFRKTEQPPPFFKTNRWSDPVSDPIPFVVPPQSAAAGLPDQTILDEFWRRGLLARFAVDTIIGEIQGRGYTVTIRSTAPKYVPELREILATFYGQGQGWSPSAVSAFMFKKGITSSKGTPANISDAVSYLVERGEVIKHSSTHYEYVQKGS